VHYHSPLDIIAINMKCCNEYYPCIDCHEETAGHNAEAWPKKYFDTNAILCDAYNNEMSANDYLGSNYQCPFCKAVFNPGCKNHHPLYFEV